MAKLKTLAIALAVAVAPMLATWPGGVSAEPPTLEEIRASVALGVDWLAGAQQSDGSFGGYDQVAHTALAVKKLMHHAVDPEYGLGLPSPFDDANPYKAEVILGLNYILANGQTMPISPQPAGDPDTNGNGLGVYFETSGNIWHRNYTTGITLMTLCEAVELDRLVESGPLAGWTYADVAQDTMEEVRKVMGLSGRK